MAYTPRTAESVRECLQVLGKDRPLGLDRGHSESREVLAHHHPAVHEHMDEHQKGEDLICSRSHSLN